MPVMTSLQENDAQSLYSEDLNNSRGSRYDMERSRIDDRNKYTHLYQNDDEYLTKKNLTRCCIGTLVVLFFIIVIVAIVSSDSHNSGGGGDKPDDWTPAFIDPPLGPYSSWTCEKYLNKNITHPSPRVMSTYGEHEDWTLKEIWVYQENAHRKTESKWIITIAIKLIFANGVEVPEDLDEIPYIDYTIANITKIAVDTSKPIKSLQALAFCGIRLFDADDNILNDVEIWNTFWCPHDHVEWDPKVEIPDGQSLIGLTLGVAEQAMYQESQMCAITYHLWDTPTKQ